MLYLSAASNKSMLISILSAKNYFNLNIQLYIHSTTRDAGDPSDLINLKVLMILLILAILITLVILEIIFKFCAGVPPQDFEI